MGNDDDGNGRKRSKAGIASRALHALRLLFGTSQRRLVVFSFALILLFHLVLWRVYFQDSSLSGRAQRWLRWHGLPTSLQSTKKQRRRMMGKKKHSNVAVVVFLHPPRIGGISIKHNLYKTDFGILLHHPHLIASLERESKEMETILNATDAESAANRRNRNGEPIIHLVVLHDDLGRLAHVQATLERWRLLADEHDKHMFLFSVVRDPVDYAVSCFNEYRVEPCVRDHCIRPLLDPTQDNLLQSMAVNDQCQGLARNATNKTLVTEQECNDVYDWMTHHMDWIGTTDTLNTYTLPLLAEFMLGDADRSETFTLLNEQQKPNKLTSSSLDEATKRKIRQASKLDQQLYDKVKAKYYF